MAWVAIIVTLSMNLGRHPLFDPDEGRNAEVGREMAETNDYVVPRLNGLPYLDKPILNFAAQAAFTEVLGANETSARLPSLLWTLLTIALISWFARRELGGDADIVAALALASCPIVIAFARIVIFDAATSLCISAAAIAFYLSIEADEQREAKKKSILAWCAMGLGILAKGPVTLLLPLLAAIPYGIYRKRTRRVWSTVGFILFIGIIAPWIYGMSRAVPEFLEYSLVTETARRFATNELKRNAPFWYFIPLLFAGALPWVITLAAGVRRDEKSDGRWSRVAVFAFFWLVVPFVFFSISKSKRPQYLLPLIPPVALLVAWHYERMRERLRGGMITAGVYIALGAALLVGLSMGLHLKTREHMHAAVHLSAVLICVTLLISAIVAILARRNAMTVICALAAPMLLIPITAAPVIDAIASHRSSRELARRLDPRAKIVTVRAYSPTLAFYGKKHLTVVTADATELTSNYLIRSFDKWARRPDTPFRSYDWVESAVQSCDQPTYFMTEPKEKEARELLGRYLPLVDKDDELEVYGPCKPGVRMAGGERDAGAGRLRSDGRIAASGDVATPNSGLRTPNSRFN